MSKRRIQNTDCKLWTKNFNRVRKLKRVFKTRSTPTFTSSKSWHRKVDIEKLIVISALLPLHPFFYFCHTSRKTIPETFVTRSHYFHNSQSYPLIAEPQPIGWELTPGVKDAELCLKDAVRPSVTRCKYLTVVTKLNQANVKVKQRFQQLRGLSTQEYIKTDCTHQ